MSSSILVYGAQLSNLLKIFETLDENARNIFLKSVRASKFVTARYRIQPSVMREKKRGSFNFVIKFSFFDFVMAENNIFRFRPFWNLISFMS